MGKHETKSLWDYAKGTLSEEVSAKVAAHLEVCVACQKAQFGYFVRSKELLRNQQRVWHGTQYFKVNPDISDLCLSTNGHQQGVTAR